MLIGALDPTRFGILAPDEVFIQVQEPSPVDISAAVSSGLDAEDHMFANSEVIGGYGSPNEQSANGRVLRVVTGEILVSKNPCLHPGDVRRLRAVDRPELRHLVNCIVFSQVRHSVSECIIVSLPNAWCGVCAQRDDLIWQNVAAYECVPSCPTAFDYLAFLSAR